ncbi:site-specific integrase [Acidaminococcus fermentans]|uniref:tyrosine-type recombinase/integrase n=1 Tax=Acidaminococcus fermentans TaxID=905 RepID=UPI00307AE0C3
MKLPNGFGTCYKLGGNRRRPWVVKKTINGKQKTLGYFATYVDGLSHLFAVNDTDVMQSEIPFSAIYERWRKEHFPSISVSSQKAYEICFRHLSPLHSRAFSSLKYRDLQEAIDQVHLVAGYATQKKVKGLLEQLYDYAIRYDIVTTDYASRISIDPHIPVYKKKPFTVRERNRLWANTETPFVVDVLILIYTGLRCGEYLNIKASDVKIRQRCLVVRKSKTRAGIRQVPVSKKIWPFVLARIQESTWLCPCRSYDSFRRQWDKVMKALSMHHTPHEARHTTASMLDSAGINDTVVKMILGHARKGVTKAVYTHKTLYELRKAVDIL